MGSEVAVPRWGYTQLRSCYEEISRITPFGWIFHKAPVNQILETPSITVYPTLLVKGRGGFMKTGIIHRSIISVNARTPDAHPQEYIFGRFS